MIVGFSKYGGHVGVRCEVDETDAYHMMTRFADETQACPTDWLAGHITRGIVGGNGWTTRAWVVNNAVLVWPRCLLLPKDQGPLLTGLKADVLRLLADDGFTVEVKDELPGMSNERPRRKPRASRSPSRPDAGRQAKARSPEGNGVAC